jgi:hypothetical protein
MIKSLSTTAGDVLAGAMDGSSPVMGAYVRGILKTTELLEDWKGDCEPPMPDNPFSNETQDALYRAFLSGCLMYQASKIEEMLGGMGGAVCDD